MGRKKSLVDESMMLNQQTYIYYFNMLKALSINIFEWKNLPPTIDERFLELALFETGTAVFFKDENLGYLALTTLYGSPLNVYRIPIYRQAYAVTGYTNNLSMDDSVLIFNNYLHEPKQASVEMFARRLTNIERAIDVNISAQRTPNVILCDEDQRMVMQNLYMQYDGNCPFIFGSKDLDLKGVQILNTTAPYVVDKLQLQKKEILSEALTQIGIESQTSAKAERMLTNEITSNLGQTEAQRFVMLNARQQACDQINTMFGLDISVDYRSKVGILSQNLETQPYEDKEEVDSLE